MEKISALSHTKLTHKTNPAHLDFETTADIHDLTEFVGQTRALKAIELSIGLNSKGYNLYAMGPSGVGKLSLVRSILETVAAKQPVPWDYCYIYNFDDPHKPIALQLPAGLGRELRDDMQSLVEDLSRQEKETRREFTLMAVHHFIEELKQKYNAFSLVIDYLNAVERDVILNVKEFLKREENVSLPTAPANHKTQHTRYLVNVIVDNCEKTAAPVIYEENPSCLNLTGRIEHIAQFGTLITDFSLLRPGSLHHANGGYLIIDALKLLREPFAWEGLKRALNSAQIKIELPESTPSLLSTVSLDPSPIPLQVKIILLGNRMTYYTLCESDPEFDELFKVSADFEEEIDRTPETQQQYARLIATLAHKAQVLPLHRNAVAAILDYSTRLAEDQLKLSTHLRRINDLILESDYFAKQQNHPLVYAEDVHTAISAAINRLDRIRQSFYESIQRNFILILTTGERVGQINGLTLIELGHFNFGHPTRITAVIHPGSGHIIDIEREVEMSGPIHAKGVLILTGFIVGRYVTDASFSLSASLVFEQTYNAVEGDSASAAELCCLLSAIADLPMKQGLAITGSINQLGDIQVIGGVNEKIEGFFDICHNRGLTGTQGVIIPAINKQNLVLRDDVIAAVKAKKFHIYPVTSIDEAITLLTGIPAGQRGKTGKFPRDTVNYLVEKNLENFAQKMRDPPRKKGRK